MIFSFDVESIGLYGEGFAVGGVLVDKNGNELSSFRYSSNPDYSTGSESDRAWIKDHVPPIAITHDSAQLVRDAFWDQYIEARHHNALIVVDCGYPVETNFLAACVRNFETTRKWLAPYPLYDLSTLLLLCGLDPKAAFDRQPNELPIHDPLADSRQTARLWIEFHDYLCREKV